MSNNPPNKNTTNFGVTSPMGLDFSDFTNNNSGEKAFKYQSDLQYIDEITNSHKTIKDILTRRMNNLKILSSMWVKGNLAEAINALVLMKDTGISNDFFNYGFMKNGMNKDYLKLDQCVSLLPLIMKLINCKYEQNFRVGIKMVCMIFDMYSNSILIVKRSQKVNVSSEDTKLNYEHLITFFEQITQSANVKNRNLDNDQNLKALLVDMNALIDTCKRAG